MKLPKNAKIRPTTDKVRAALFSILGNKVIDANILDLFAGTGSLGLEALSRGASKCTFVDLNIKTIIENTAFVEKNKIVIKKADTFRILKKSEEAYDLIFADPPYGQYDSNDFFKRIDKTFLADKGIIIYEESSKTEVERHSDFYECFDVRKYGDTNIYFWRKLL